MQPKKIALISDAWVPQVNGVVTTFQSVIPLLEKKGFEIKILHPEMFNNFSYPWYKEIKISFNTKTVTEKFFKEFNPDIVHIMTEGPVGFAGRKYCLKNKLRYTSSFHTRFPDYIKQRAYIPKSLTYSILRRLHDNSVNVLVPSLSMVEELERYNFKNLKVWNRGVDTELFNPNKRIRNDNDIQLTYVGRVAIEKNIEEFLKMPSHLPKIVVGGGPSLKSYAKKYPDVEFVGFKKGKELADYYRDAACFVFPSLTDTFGIVLIEALACGTPLAGFNVTGPKDIVIEGVNGSLDDKNLENAVKRALQVDRTSTFNSSKTYTWDTVAEQFVNSLVPMK